MRISDWSSDVCSSDLWAAQYYGWRAAFILVGLPGFLLALATKFLLREPRLQAGFAVTPEKTEPVRQGIRLLFAKPADRHIVYAPILYFRSEEHPSELQSLMRISYAVFCSKKKKSKTRHIITIYHTLVRYNSPA